MFLIPLQGPGWRPSGSHQESSHLQLRDQPGSELAALRDEPGLCCLLLQEGEKKNSGVFHNSSQAVLLPTSSRLPALLHQNRAAQLLGDTAPHVLRCCSSAKPSASAERSPRQERCHPSPTCRSLHGETCPGASMHPEPPLVPGELPGAR